MSRIRSIHPGIHTDERFVSVQPFARLLFIGIWNECDDQGLFEWSPLKLKMRLLPADPVDAAALLDELAAAGMVLRYEVDGRAFGAVRNFGRYQRPKKPTAVHPSTEPALAFATSGSVPLPHPFPTAPEEPPQRKEEGGRMEEEGSVADATGAEAPKSPSAIDLRAAVFASGIPLLSGTGLSDANARSMIGRWRKTYTDGAVLDALSAATAETPSDPVAWITRTLEVRNANGKHRGHGDPRRNAAGREEPIFAARRALGIDREP